MQTPIHNSHLYNFLYCIYHCTTKYCNLYDDDTKMFWNSNLCLLIPKTGYIVQIFKRPYDPRAQPEVVHFLISNESPYFSSCKSKIHLQILCSSGDMTKNVKLIGIPENNFLCIFITASSPGVHSFFCLWRVNKKLPQGETSQNAFQKSRSIN